MSNLKRENLEELMNKKFSYHIVSSTLLSIVVSLAGLQNIQANSDGSCKHIKKELCKIERALTACGTEIVIDSVPFTASTPGKYCVNNDLTLPLGGGTAITVTANNVTINFNNHSLTLDDPTSVGISATGISELTIQNDVIQTPLISSSISSAAIELINCTKVTLDNIFTLNTFYGVSILGSNDVFITHSQFNNHSGATSTVASCGIKVDASLTGAISSNIIVEESTFTEIITTNPGTLKANPILYQGGSVNCRVSSCNFNNCASLLALIINGLIIENSTFAQPSNAVLAAIQTGSGPATNLVANDIIIRGCILFSTTTVAGGSLIAVIQGDGCLIEDCVLDIPNSSSEDAMYSNSPSARNCIMRNCLIRGSLTGAAHAVDLGGQASIVDNCQIIGGGSGKNGSTVLFAAGCIDCVVKNSDISAGANVGVDIRGTSANSVLFNNIIRDNAGNGVQIDVGAVKARVENNKVFANGANGILNSAGTSSQIYFNTVCGNTSTDCMGFPSLCQTPGTSGPVVGANVACTFS